MKPTNRSPLTTLIALALALVGCRLGRDGSPANSPPEDEVWLSQDQIDIAGIRIAEASEKELPRALSVGGKVDFDDLRVTHVFSPVAGRVTRVLARPGQRLDKGDPLMVVISPDVGEAFADLVKAQADLLSSEAEFHRQARLFEERATARREFEASDDDFRKARAEYDRAQKKASMLRSGELNVVTQEYTLKSFIDGEVIARNVNPGIEVQGQYSGGSPNELFTIGDIKKVWVFADVPDRDLPNVQPGNDVEIQVIAWPGRIFRGKVDWISSEVDPDLRTGRIRSVIANEDEALKPEMLATVSILQPPVRRLAVPADVVVRLNESTFVFVESGRLQDGRRIFKRRRVIAGSERAGLVPILDGIKAGERVVTEGVVSLQKPRDEVWVTSRQLDDAHITVAIVQEHDVQNGIALGGRLAFDDLRVSHVFSPVNGRITSVLARLGQRVERGSPLLAISSPDVGQFASDVLKAEADLTAAQHEYKRQKELYSYAPGVHAGTLTDLESAEANWRKARAELDRARQKTQLLESGTVDRVSQDFILRSPIEGEVVARMANPGLEIQGQYSNGNNVVELFTIGNTDKLWVLGDVYEMDRPHINEGDEVTLRVAAWPDKIFHGSVDWVSDVLDPELHTARVRCIIDNSEHLLRPEMYESLRVEVPAKRTLAIPREALLRVGRETVVFVATGKVRPDGAIIFKRRTVAANEEVTGDLIPVRNGLAAGETIAVEHSILLLGML
jgi:cobalt-zinc-cadmium efflux system membrane fusion protein